MPVRKTVSIADGIVLGGDGFVVIAGPCAVETREQLSALQALGCQLGQGFLFARPMDAAEFSRSLATRSLADLGVRS